MSRLLDRVAIVTGASKGIGAGIARQLAADGAKVVISYASGKDGADAVLADIKAAGGTAIALRADVRQRADTEALVEAAREHFGRLDILVNNAGVYRFARIEDTTADLYRLQFDINVLGPLQLISAASPYLGAGSSIINISSNVTSVLPAESAVYSGTKGALDAITGVLARELGPRGIRVNAVNPGLIDTEGTQTAGALGAEFQAWNEARTPLGRIGQVGDIAPIVAFLASEDARWVTGETLFGSGGMR